MYCPRAMMSHMGNAVAYGGWFRTRGQPTTPVAVAVSLMPSELLEVFKGEL